MTDYELLTPETVPAYVATRPQLSGLVDAGSFEAVEVGDGNLNLVFLGRDHDGRGLCLKQSLPYVRLVGSGWPLTPNRVAAEARGYRAAAEHDADLMPACYDFDPDRFILAVENLQGWRVWRDALNGGEIHEGVAEAMGRYVAGLAFHTSLFSLGPEELKARASAATNPELCRITEDLVFTQPYLTHDNNSFTAQVAPVVGELQDDQALRAEVGVLKHRFMTAAEALIHGDLHTGSVMVTHTDDGGARGKAIDCEFCFYGPVGFDLGALIGNYAIASVRAAVMGRPAAFRSWLAGLPSATWNAFVTELRALWPERSETFLTDGFLDAWLGAVLRDATGFAGCKANRRIIGLAKVADIESLEGDQHTAAATAVLRIGRRLILERHAVSGPGDAERVIADVIQEEVGS